MTHSKGRKSKPASTQHKISVVEERILNLHSEFAQKQQILVNNMMLLRDLKMLSAMESMKIALTLRLRKMLKESPDSLVEQSQHLHA